MALNYFLLSAIEWICLSLFVLVSEKLICGEMRKRNFRFPSWLPYAVNEVGTAIIFLIYGFTPQTFCGIALLMILLFASVQDDSTHEADNVLSLMIFLLGLSTVTEENILSKLLAAGLVFGIQLFVCLFCKKAGIGGADIKLSTATVFLLGLWKGLLGLMLGMLIAIVAELILCRKNNKKSTEPFPLIPYLSVGFIIGYII